MMDWYYIEERQDGQTTGACFVRSPGRTATVLSCIARGLIHPFAELDIRHLPRLQDEVPDHFLDRRLDVSDLRELDIHLGGDGSGTTPISERELPWMK